MNAKPTGMFLILAASVLTACQTSQDAAAPTHTPASAPPASVSERLVDSPTRRVMRLSNGFTIILQQNKTAPVVAVRIYVKAGALTEQKYMSQGISHVVEHLVAGAQSGKRKEEQNTLLLEQIGNDSNAETSEDETVYFITTNSEKWPVALDLLVDCTTNSDFTREQFNREFQVVQREIEMDEAEADRVFYAHTQTNRYIKSPAMHPVIGYKPNFQLVTYEDVKAYYHQMYVPDNMIISVAGDMDLDAAEKLITDQLAHVRRRPVPTVPIPPEPNVVAPRLSVSHADVRQARVEWAFPTIDTYDPDLYATDVLASVLGGSESSILVRKLRDDLDDVVGLSVADETPRYAVGQLEIDAILDPEKILPAQKALLEELDNIIKNGVPAEAVERAKAQATAEMIYGDQTAEQQSVRNAEDFMTTGNVNFTEEYVRHIQAVTPADVQAMAKKYIHTDQMLTTALLPLGAADPFKATVAAQSGSVEAAVSKTVLKNGLTVLITRNPAAPIACYNLYSLGGLLAETDANNGIGNAMANLMPRGTASKSHDQIADFCDATGTTLSVTSGNNSFVLSMQALKDHEPDAFNLFTDIALHPKFDAEELNHLKPQLLAAIDESTEDWFDEAYKAARDAYYADSPYKRLPVGKSGVVKALTAADIQNHYKQFFLDPAHMVLSISGDIDPAAAAQWAQQFESIPPATPKLQLTSTPSAPRTIMQHTEKQSATILLAYPPGMKITGPDRYAVILLQTYLGGYTSGFGSQLFDTLRGQGLVYTVQAENISGPAGGMFLISALGEPQNTDKILSTINRIVAETKAGKISDTAINAAKDQAITGQQLSKQTIADKASDEALDELLGLGYDDDKHFAEKISALSKQDIINAANKYLNAPIILITTPDAKK